MGLFNSLLHRSRKIRNTNRFVPHSIFPPFWPTPNMATKYPDPQMDSEPSMTLIDIDIDNEATPDDDFRTVTSGRNVRRKKRKIREGSLGVEDIMASRADSSSEAEPHDHHVFRTPSTKPPDLKLFIRPIDRNKPRKP